MHKEQKSLNIDVKKGSKEGDFFKFDNLSDESPGMKPGNLVFLIKEIPHDRFKRVGDYLFST